MTLVKFNPTHPDSFNSFVENIFGKTMNELFDLTANYGTIPSVNISDNGSVYKVELAAPGLNKENFGIEVNNNVLTIQYKQEEKAEEQNQRFYKREFNFTAFKRAFSLPKNANLEAITASYQNGVLAIEVPKKEEFKNGNSHKIEIN